MARNQKYHCSFCGKDQSQVRRLIAGPNFVYICDECVALCNEILAETPTTAPATPDAREDEQPGDWNATIHRL